SKTSAFSKVFRKNSAYRFSAALLGNHPCPRRRSNSGPGLMPQAPLTQDAGSLVSRLAHPGGNLTGAQPRRWRRKQTDFQSLTRADLSTAADIERAFDVFAREPNGGADPIANPDRYCPSRT